MTMLCESIPRGKVRDADGLLAAAGMDFRIQSIIDQIDFDVDAALDTADRILEVHDELSGGRPDDCTSLLAAVNADWVGPARNSACDHVECQRTFWDQVLDFLLWLTEQIVQIVDWIVDGLRVAVAWITWIATALAALLLVIAVIVGVFTAGIGAVVASVMEAPAMTVLGILAGLGVAASALLYGLNLLVEWLQTIIRDARSRFCGDGIPSLPDFDPEGPWFPPAFPQ